MATILLVNNHEENRTYLSNLLTHAGHRVMEARDKAHALNLAIKESIDLVICDIHKPSQDGLAQTLTNDMLERDQNERQSRLNEERLRQLSNRLLQLQDEERRRIARELHDSTSQCLAIISINLDWLRQNTHSLSAETARIVAESRELIDLCAQEIRTTSYLLHPPLLDQVGLGCAIGEFAQGFERRSGIAVTVSAPADFGRLSGETEVALFRVVQESLANIHKHSGSSTAAVRLSRDAEYVILEIEDKGRGLPPGLLQNDGPARLGVGILGMRERLKQLKGQLEIASSTSGVLVRAAAPLD